LHSDPRELVRLRSQGGLENIWRSEPCNFNRLLVSRFTASGEIGDQQRKYFRMRPCTFVDSSIAFQFCDVVIFFRVTCEMIALPEVDV
jgi:hypothetical protein